MILYSRLSDRKTYVEFWGASTKHPDSISPTLKMASLHLIHIKKKVAISFSGLCM